MRRRGGSNFGLMLLVFQLFSFIQYLSSRNEFVPTTLVLLGINILAFIRPELNINYRGRNFIRWPSISESCISVQSVWFQKDWKRLVLAPFIHADSWHLYYNLASFMWKARTLERHYGSLYFAYLMATFSILTSTLYVALNFAAAEFFDSWSYVNTCAVGFSGVIFAVKVLTTHLQPGGMTFVMGIGVPLRLAVWAELILISVLVPNASFVGHLAGILVGLAYVSGPLKQLMDIPFNLFTGGVRGSFRTAPSYDYAARPSGSHRQGGNHSQYNRENEELQEAIRRSLNDDPPPEDNHRPPPYNPEYDDSDEQERIRAARLRRLAPEDRRPLRY